jgi:hypothetical protein
MVDNTYKTWFQKFLTPVLEPSLARKTIYPQSKLYVKICWKIKKWLFYAANVNSSIGVFVAAFREANASYPVLLSSAFLISQP